MGLVLREALTGLLVGKWVPAAYRSEPPLFIARANPMFMTTNATNSSGGMVVPHAPTMVTICARVRLATESL